MLKLKKIKPLANYVLITGNTYDEEESKQGGIITKTRGALKEYQTVVAVGPVVRGVKEGDLVCVDYKRYAQFKHQEGSLKDGVISDNPVIKYHMFTIDLDGITHLLITDQDIKFIVEDSEEIQESNIITPDTKIIM